MLVFLFVLVVGMTFFDKNKTIQFGNGTVIFPKQRVSIGVETALTDKQRRAGLMHRDKLPKNMGMLFVFEQEYIQKVWMKNTLIPLDVIFISAQNKVVSFLKNLKPCKKKDCNIYTSDGAAKYMLEVNAGLINRECIEIGQKVRITFPL